METAIPREKIVQEILDAAVESGQPLDPEVIQANLALLGFSQLVVNSTEAHFSRYGISQGRFAVLVLLRYIREQSWTPAKLAKQVGATRATLTGLLDGLESDSWIERTANPEDGRSYLVVLTRSGRNRLRKILPDHWERTMPLTSQLTKAERKTLLSLITKLTTNFAKLMESAKQIPNI